MSNTYAVRRPQRMAQMVLVVLLVGLTVLTTACGGNPQTQHLASQNKSQLDQLTQQAQKIGVPIALLNPILKQYQQLSSSSAPFSLFNDQPATDYYKNLANQYSIF